MITKFVNIALPPQREPVRALKIRRKITEVTSQYDGHLLDLVGVIVGDNRTGRLVVDFNQGREYRMEFTERTNSTTGV